LKDKGNKIGRMEGNKFIAFHIIASLFAASVILQGCGGADVKQYIRSNANFQYIKKVAILPFNNLTDDKFAGEKVKSIITLDVLESGVFEVAEEGEVNKIVADVFREMGYREGELVSLDLESIKRIAEKLGVQAIFIGSVESYGQRGGGSTYSIVSISLKLVEANSGITLWRGYQSQKGSSVSRSVLGIEQKNEIELSRDISSQLLSTILRK
jgi:TolB-like protein